MEYQKRLGCKGTSIVLTELGGVGVRQALQKVLHLDVGHLVQVDQGVEAVKLLEARLGPLRDLAGLHLALGVEGEEDGVEHISVHLHQSFRDGRRMDKVKCDNLKAGDDVVGDDHQGSVSPGVGLRLLHLVLWGKNEGEDSDDGDGVQDQLTVPHQVSAELQRVVVVGLVLVVKLPLLQLLAVVT